MGKIGRAAIAVMLLGGILLAAGGCAGATRTPDEAIQASGQELRQSVSKHVEDPGRREQMLSLVGEIESTQRSFSTQSAEFAQQYARLNADFNAPRAQFEQLFADFNAHRIQSRYRILDLHFQLTALATEQEWKRIGKVEAQLYEEAAIARAAQAGGT